VNPPSFFERLVRRFKKTLSVLFFIDQWVIMTGRDLEYDRLQWSAFRPLIPEKDRYWADPFIVHREDRYYVFMEEKMYATGLGRIVCLTLDPQGNLLSSQVVLERPYHLSYPFTFEFRRETYMLPETAANRTLELYRATRFPDQWQLAKTLMTGLYAVDATLLEYNHKWWLFANIKEEGASSLDALHLFYADDPLADRWLPHPRNPVVKDIHSARPAGRIFMHEGKFIRPSQDSSERYGKALKFNRILKLDELDYQEIPDAEFRPQGRNTLATHTFNQAGQLTVIDAVVRRRK
jgi:hypothetical protein